FGLLRKLAQPADFPWFQYHCLSHGCNEDSWKVEQTNLTSLVLKNAQALKLKSKNDSSCGQEGLLLTVFSGGFFFFAERTLNERDDPTETFEPKGGSDRRISNGTFNRKLES
ncbi:MAG: hypothetical protein WCO91_11800, partial [Gemmataceae bacterium]